jgi:hypothetical protein
MLGSAHDGERAAAAAAADALRRKLNVSWAELLQPVVAEANVPDAALSPDAILRNHWNILSKWQREFLESLSRWQGPFTPKQEAVLAKIRTRCGGSQ